MKTSDTERCRGFESLSLRHFFEENKLSLDEASSNLPFQYGEVPKLAEGAPLLRV